MRASDERWRMVGSGQSGGIAMAGGGRVGGDARRAPGTGAAAVVDTAATVAALVLDADCRLVWTSGAALRVLAQSEALRLVGDRLVVGFRAAAALRRAVACAAGAVPCGDRACGTEHALLLPQASSAPLVATVTPLLPAGRSPKTSGAVLLLVHNAYRGGAVEMGVMRELYDLTAAEARLGALLADGHSPRECATKLGVSLHTVRTHLKRLFDKTGTNRQAALVRRLLGVPARALR